MVQRIKAGLGCCVGGVAIYRGLCEERFVVEKTCEVVGERKGCRSERRVNAETGGCALCTEREGKGRLQRGQRRAAVCVLCRDFDF